MQPVVVSSFLPGEGHYRSKRFTVRAIECDDAFGYWRGLSSIWDGPTFVNLEHDLEVTDEQIAELLECPQPLCSWAYQMHWISTHLAADVYAHSNNGQLIAEGAEWADWSAIGLIKIAPEARIAPLRQVVWGQVEQAIAEAVSGPWHMHWPAITHHHF